MRAGVVGLGKMGLSHLAMLRAHPEVELAGVCDATGYLLDVLARYTGLKTYADYDKMLAEADIEAIVIATPSKFHVPMVRKALEKGLHVFCEKPFALDTRAGTELIKLAADTGLVNQIGYHNRFVGTFKEVKRLLDLGTIGRVSHISAEAYGPVVLRPPSATWRTKRGEGGGCLYDYAAHPLNLVNWYMGMPRSVGGTVLNKIFSKETEDEVYSTLYFEGGQTGQLSVNWSDESHRKMTTKITIWGTKGRIYADRQEVQVYLRDTADLPENYTYGRNVKYTTELSDPVWFYLRGEEYSAQLNYFLRTITDGLPAINSFESALITDQVIDMLLEDVGRERTTSVAASRPASVPSPLRRWLGLAGS